MVEGKIKFDRKRRNHLARINDRRIMVKKQGNKSLLHGQLADGN